MHTVEIRKLMYGCAYVQEIIHPVKLVVLSHTVKSLHAYCSNYSPVAIIRNAKIWNIILLVAFFRTLSSNLDLE